MLFGDEFRFFLRQLEVERRHRKSIETELEKLKSTVKLERKKKNNLQEEADRLSQQLVLMVGPEEKEELLDRIAELEIRVKILENENKDLEKLASSSYVSFPRLSFASSEGGSRKKQH
ncbi:hypothetical protein TWF506_005478 [Arthrobotrys conoides]|uniref:Uncharacterized protein n=1 Tax=Arthrobotrys conoides TaxID=74498 RepID=A0AAN8PPU0_9PEZI